MERLPEGHGEPNGHQHEGGPLVLGLEAGQDVGPNLKAGQTRRVLSTTGADGTRWQAPPTG